MLYFAYGSNMLLPMMRRRCPGARHLGRAVLPGYRFIIMRGGYASVARSPGHSVHGLLWRLTARDVAVLNAYENLDGGLYRGGSLAVVAGRRRLRALVYVGRSRIPGRPRPGYLELVTDAARDAGLPPHYVRSLQRWTRAAARKRGETP
jgi:Gamma-glutamyl cyclotransferase, AIG2-like